MCNMRWICTFRACRKALNCLTWPIWYVFLYCSIVFFLCFFWSRSFVWISSQKKYLKKSSKEMLRRVSGENSGIIFLISPQKIGCRYSCVLRLGEALLMITHMYLWRTKGSYPWIIIKHSGFTPPLGLHCTPAPPPPHPTSPHCSYRVNINKS